MVDIIYPDESYTIVGACFNVYNEIGPGFLEAVYQECLEIEYELLGIPYVSQKELTLTYKGRELQKRYKPDFLCYNKIIVEIKAESALTDTDRSQAFNYLNATEHKLCILANFCSKPKLEYERIIL